MSSRKRFPANSQLMQDLNRAVTIHICKDGTVTYRMKGQKAFNGIAFPVFSVDTEQQAKDLQTRFCRLSTFHHPKMKPQEKWYKLSNLPDGTDLALRPEAVLELEDLKGITAMFRTFYADHLARTR